MSSNLLFHSLCSTLCSKNKNLPCIHQFNQILTLCFFFHLPQKKKPKTSPTTINPLSPPPPTFADVNYIANHRLPPLYAPQIKTCYVSTILTLCFFFSSTQKKKKKPKMSPTTINSRDFLKNNYKTQTISLVSKRFKLISFITIRVQWTRFRKN